MPNVIVLIVTLNQDLNVETTLDYVIIDLLPTLLIHCKIKKMKVKSIFILSTTIKMKLYPLLPTT